MPPIVLSEGRHVLAEANQWPAGDMQTAYYPRDLLLLSRLFSSYAHVYKTQLWVYVVVNKVAGASASLELKTYEKTDRGRRQIPEHPYAQLLAHPNPVHDPVFFWIWTVSTKQVYGEAMWVKFRDAKGRVKMLWPLHPANTTVRTKGDVTTYELTGKPDVKFDAADVVHFKMYNPESSVRGLSPLEPLRQTLLNEDAARRATAAFWANGGRPSIALVHPGTLANRNDANAREEARKRLSQEWQSIHGGSDNFGKAAILEEGMEPKVLSLSAEDAQYIESRKLNREEACAALDVPPPVVHILDHATYSNITEQMRSMYRDTMGPKLNALEATIHTQLRPDFADESVYAKFDMDRVLRGDFEKRIETYTKAITSGVYQPAEVREWEDLPFVEGSDRLFMQGATVPIELAGVQPSKTPESKGLEVQQMRTLMGRTARLTSLDDIDPDRFVEGLNGDAAIVLQELDQARTEGKTLEDFRTRLKALIRVEDPLIDQVRDLSGKISSLVNHPQPIIVQTPAAEPPKIDVDVHLPETSVAIEPGAVQVDVHLPESKPTTWTVERDDEGNFEQLIPSPSEQED